MADLENFRIEIPSWAFANTGTRFGKFLQPAAATNLEEKFADAAQVHALTGVTPSLALHVLWDLPGGLSDVSKVKRLVAHYGIRAGSINPNLFQNQEYKFGSICSPDASVRRMAIEHLVDSAKIAQELNSMDVSLWIADGSSYPGSQSIRHRILWLEEALGSTHDRLSPGQRLLIEYKPFEPAFYHTDVADWGMATHLAQNAGPQARVLVDTGHHYQSQNIEQIVAWLLHKRLLGGFHFNDRRYADDDLTIGSIDPYQVFRIFHEIFNEEEAELVAGIAYMIDQSHNLKGKIEAMIQTVTTILELFAKAALVDHKKLAKLQESCDLVDAESCLKDAFSTDVRPAIREWARAKGLAEDPMDAFRQSGYLERITAERSEKNMAAITSYA
jgi:L-rhamnose isomerase/sugar isomerase